LPARLFAFRAALKRVASGVGTAMTSEKTPDEGATPAASVRHFLFGPFTLDTSLGELRRGGVLLPLRGQPLQMLELLLRTPGELVTRDSLRREIWSDGTIVEFDDALNHCVQRLRQALADPGGSAPLIQTIPRRGYRILTEVQAIPHLRDPALRALPPAWNDSPPVEPPVAVLGPHHSGRLESTDPVAQGLRSSGNGTSDGPGRPDPSMVSASEGSPAGGSSSSRSGPPIEHAVGALSPETPPPADAASPPGPALVQEPARARPHPRWKRWVRAGLLGLAGVLLAVLARPVVQRWHPGPPPPPPSPMVATGEAHERERNAASPFAPIVPAGPRRPAAVLTLVNRSADPSLEWVGTALPELLSSRLGEIPTLRVVPRQTVALAAFSLGVPTPAAVETSMGRRLQEFLGPELTVAGRYRSEGDGSRRLRVDLSISDVKKHGVVATVSEAGDLGELRGLSDRLAEKLRQAMGWEPARVEDRDFWRSPLAADPLPRDPEAMRLYSEAIARLWRGDESGAQPLLAQVSSREPSFLFADRAQATVCLDARCDAARIAAQRLRKAAQGRPGEEWELLQAQMDCFEIDDQPEPCKAATPAFRRLWERHRGDLEYGLALVFPSPLLGGLNAPPEFVIELIPELRKLPGASAATVRLDLAEVESLFWTEKPDWKRILSTAKHGKAAARRGGDRFYLGHLLFDEGCALGMLNRGRESRAAHEESIRVFLSTGAVSHALRWLGRASDWREPAARRAALEKGLLLSRGMGPAGVGRTEGLLTRLGWFEFQQGNLDAADAASGELEALQKANGRLSDHQLPEEVLLARARPQEAEALARADLAAYADQPMTAALAHGELARALVEEDRLAEATKEFQQMKAGPVGSGLECIEIEQLLVTGRELEARQKLRVALEAEGELPAEWSGEALMLLQLLLNLNQFDEAEQILRRIEPKVDPHRSDAGRARQKVLIAGVDLGLGRTAKAITRLREVLAQATRAGWKQAELEARLTYCRAQRAAGNETAGVNLLESLERESRSLGMLRIARLAHRAQLESPRLAHAPE
jgi:DNA-binding winged helix-turn-helix (wHTH) protein